MIDEKSYKPAGLNGQDLRMGDHPIAWTRCVGQGRVFYPAIGHLPERYADREYRKILVQGIAWAADRAGQDCPAGR